MSRLANKPIAIPKNVAVNIHPGLVEIKGTKTVKFPLHPNIKLINEEGFLKVETSINQLEKTKKSKMTRLLKELNIVSGTTWSLLKNTFVGVSEGFKIKLELVGVGYRAQVQGHKVNLTLGFSHPVVFELPKEVTAETPSQTEIVLSSTDNQLLGKIAAEIRSYRPPECYKGKGIKYAGEIIIKKEAKKK